MAGSLPLSSSVAVVTGAAGAIGQASARALTDAGARVALLDVVEPTIHELAAELAGSMAVRCDVSDEASVSEAFAQVEEEMGGVSVLHGNAAVLRGPGETLLDSPVADLTLDAWNHILMVNQTGAFLSTKYALRQMLGRGEGTIITTSSIAGAFIGTDNTTYAVSKASLIGLTRCLVHQYGSQGIRAHVICPGPIHSPMIARLTGSEDLRDATLGHIPAGRFGDPSEVGALVAFLAAPGCGFLNGSIIPLDGGWTAV